MRMFGDRLEQGERSEAGAESGEVSTMPKNIKISDDLELE